ncbi:hypothetical protein LSUB1_G003840 [Lachnellula subtilissima]|uniref:Uncharacterized protein n=1 Tax=Lachnellula subtilissima TaxID=602034 RepID=A0A8H8RIH9_9HELO|nr:hypothetical protein LSUB1_G003840 [Lachnellula subtilissima]
MPTPLDKALNSKWLLMYYTRKAFTGVVTAAAVWSIWGTEMFPKESDPTGDPTTWTREELRRFLAARNLYPNSQDTNEQLLERVQANMRTPRA